MKLNPKFTFDEHQALGAELHAMRERLVHLTTDISNRYGSSKKVSKLTGKAYHALDALRCELDSVVFVDCRGKSDKELMNLYYPGPKDEK